MDTASIRVRSLPIITLIVPASRSIMARRSSHAIPGANPRTLPCFQYMHDFPIMSFGIFVWPPSYRARGGEFAITVVGRWSSACTN
eukprot:scaffold210390_cov34-Tisochrysis_lutea.AAC.5